MGNITSWNDPAIVSLNPGASLPAQKIVIAHRSDGSGSVAIARAIVSDPQVLLCDEPTGDLDRTTADEVLGILQLLNREHGKTIVLVTHDPEVTRYTKRTLHLNKGVFVERTALA